MAEQDPTPSTTQVTQMWVADTPDRLPLALLRIRQSFSTVHAYEPMPTLNGHTVVCVEVTF